jgi:hypothetical protein
LKAAPNIIPSGIEPRRQSVEAHVAAIAELLATISHDVIRVLHEGEQDALKRLNEYVPTERLLDLKEAAAYLNVTRRWLDEGTRPGREPVAPFLVIGGKKQFRKASLDAELERREVKPTEVKL